MNKLIDSIIDNLFTTEELKAFENITQNAVDVEKLKKEGNVEQTSQEVDGIVTETLNFISNDGKTKFNRTYSYYKENKKEKQIAELQSLIQIAVNREDYETAAKLKKQMNELTLIQS